MALFMKDLKEDLEKWYQIRMRSGPGENLTFRSRFIEETTPGGNALPMRRMRWRKSSTSLFDVGEPA
jgi:hypothetical protein